MDINSDTKSLLSELELAITKNRIKMQAVNNIMLTINVDKMEIISRSGDIGSTVLFVKVRCLDCCRTSEAVIHTSVFRNETYNTHGLLKTSCCDRNLAPKLLRQLIEDEQSLALIEKYTDYISRNSVMKNREGRMYDYINQEFRQDVVDLKTIEKKRAILKDKLRGPEPRTIENFSFLSIVRNKAMISYYSLIINIFKEGTLNLYFTNKMLNYSTKDYSISDAIEKQIKEKVEG